MPEEERIQLGKEIWKIVTDEVFSIGDGRAQPGGAWASASSRTTMGNIPARQYNSPDGKTPGISRPVTFFFKS